MLNYDSARNQFKNGDIVFFSGGKKNLLRRLITWFTNGPYYHVGIALWVDVNSKKTLMLAESQPDGFRVINLRFYKDRDMVVIRHPSKGDEITDFVLESIGGIRYDFMDILMIGFHEKFGTPINEKMSGKGEVCSVIISKALKRAGLSTLDIFVSPNKLFNQLTEIFDPILKVKGPL